MRARCRRSRTPDHRLRGRCLRCIAFLDSSYRDDGKHPSLDDRLVGPSPLQSAGPAA
jgi:hypothetical protein